LKCSAAISLRSVNSVCYVEKTRNVDTSASVTRADSPPLCTILTIFFSLLERTKRVAMSGGLLAGVGWVEVACRYD
jgi:hypothetical protein